MKFSHRPGSILTLLFFAVWLISARASFAEIPEDVVRLGYDLNPTGTVSIHNADGRILIYGSDGARLEIVAMRRAFTQERLEAIKVEVTMEGDAATIETVYPPAPEGLLADRSGTVDYTIFVPQSCTLAQVQLATGEVYIEGMRGKGVQAELGKGVLHVRDCFSAVRLSLGEGRMDVRYGWWEADAFSLTAEVGAGDLQVAVPAGAAMHFDALAAEGKIVNYFAPEPKGVPQLDEHFGGDSAVEFKLRITAGDIKLERAY